MARVDEVAGALADDNAMRHRVAGGHPHTGDGHQSRICIFEEEFRVSVLLPDVQHSFPIGVGLTYRGILAP
jgi:hypothetical protein